MAILFCLVTVAFAATWTPSPVEGCEPLFANTERTVDLTDADRAVLMNKVTDESLDADERRRARWTLGLFNAEEIDFLDFATPPLDDRADLDRVFAHNDRPRVIPLPTVPTLHATDESAALPYVALFDNFARQVAASPLLDGFDTPRFGIETQYLKIKPHAAWSEAARELYAMLTVGMPEYDRYGLADNWIYAFFTQMDVAYYRPGAAISFAFAEDFKEFLKSPHGTPPPAPSYLRRVPSATQDYWPVSAFSFRAWAVRPNPGAGQYLPVDIIDWENSYFGVTMSMPLPMAGLVPRWHSVKFMLGKLGREAVMTGGSSGRPEDIYRRKLIGGRLPQRWERIPAQFRQLPRTFAEYEAYLEWLSTRPFDDRHALSDPTSAPRLPFVE